MSNVECATPNCDGGNLYFDTEEKVWKHEDTEDQACFNLVQCTECYDIVDYYGEGYGWLHAGGYGDPELERIKHEPTPEHPQLGEPLNWA